MTTTNVKLGDGRVINMCALDRGALRPYLQGLAALDYVAWLLQQALADPTCKVASVPDVSEPTIAKLDPLLAQMTGLPIDEVPALSLFDWLRLVEAADRMIPTAVRVEALLVGKVTWTGRAPWDPSKEV